MLATRVACPLCGASLKVPAALPVGKKITCPRCQKPFEVPAEGLQAAAPKSPILRSQPAPLAGTETRREVELARKQTVGDYIPTATPYVGQEGQSSGLGWVLGLFVCLMLVLVAGGVVAALVSKNGLPPFLQNLLAKKPAEPAADTAKGPAPPQDPDEQGPVEEVKPDPPPEKKPDPPPPPRKPRDTDPDPWEQPANPPSALTALPKEEQERVNKTIELGVKYLKGSQGDRGTWSTSGNPIGYAALPGLTLLECGVPASDPAVQKAADYVRTSCAKLNYTYELSLAILFLDRLGDRKDRELIQTLALRLVAGQSGNGGWTYTCPVLSDKDHKLLLTALQDLSRQTSFDQIAPTIFGSDDPKERPPVMDLNKKPTTGQDAKPDPDKKPPALTGPLPDNLKKLPVLQDPTKLKDDNLTGGRTDNSNTQFATLALWAARRYDVPMERTAALIVKRFRTSQNKDGSWDYHYQVGHKGPGRNTMDCVGLLGLAVGHGIAHDLGKGKPADAKAKPSIQDEQIQKGFQALSRHIGEPVNRLTNIKQENLYFLWSVERVAVLYNLKTIGGRDWYRWGAQMLVANQQVSGSWHNGQYHGHSTTLDTCFALLFLKRANLTKDLTNKLELLILDEK